MTDGMVPSEPSAHRGRWAAWIAGWVIVAGSVLLLLNVMATFRLCQGLGCFFVFMVGPFVIGGPLLIGLGLLAWADSRIRKTTDGVKRTTHAHARAFAALGLGVFMVAAFAYIEERATQPFPGHAWGTLAFLGVLGAALMVPWARRRRPTSPA